jgi:hypothetical protein
MEHDDVSGIAFTELAGLLDEIEADLHSPARMLATADERAVARQFVLSALQHALQFWADADPARPWFHRWITPSKKLLGDNPDALYYGTVIDPAREYRIRGNLHGAVYTSFTVEAGTAGGGMSQRLAATLNDTEFDVAADGSYELIAGVAERPRNWLRLTPDSGSITTRHYWEWDRPAGLDPTLEVPLSIEPLEPVAPPAIPGDADVAANLRRVATFLRSATVGWPTAPPDTASLPWLSLQPNVFANPESDDGNAAIGFAAIDNVYRSARYVLGPDEALVIRGRFPRCRFANVVLFNRFMQTPPHRERRCSLNRRQTVHEADGTFRMVVAHRDPGVPNWLDTAGAPSGTMFWRFLLPEERIGALEAEVVPVDDLSRVEHARGR